jgi:hypothetical protein
MQKMKWRSNVEYAMGSWGRPLKYGNLNLFFFWESNRGPAAHLNWNSFLKATARWAT